MLSMKRVPYVAGSIDRIFMVRWRSFEVPDLARVRAEIGAARKLAQQPIVYLSLIRASTRVFTEEERHALLGFLTDLLADCASIHHVIDGEGFVSSARRSIVTNLARSTPRASDFYTYATLEAAMVSIGKLVNARSDELMREARAQGVAFRENRDNVT